MEQKTKRLFFGLEVHAPWPSEWPKGRILKEKHRHLTLAFLGNISYKPLHDLLKDFPRPPIQVGSVGYFDACLTLPLRHPNVIAWHAQWLDSRNPLINFQQVLIDWLVSHHYSLEKREWMPHLTLCRQPFNKNEWKKAFHPLPFFTSSIHLYESQGHLNYQPLWSSSILPPFEEIDHTADMAFRVRGETIQQIYHNAFIALTFKFPEFLNFFESDFIAHSLDEVIIALNEIIARVDSQIGSPLKAVSFHGELVNTQDSLLQWEMIVDV